MTPIWGIFMIIHVDSTIFQASHGAVSIGTSCSEERTKRGSAVATPPGHRWLPRPAAEGETHVGPPNFESVQLVQIILMTMVYAIYRL